MGARSISLLVLLTLLSLVALACAPQRAGGGGGGDDSTPCDNYCVLAAECSADLSVTTCQEAYGGSAGETEAVQDACQAAVDLMVECGCNGCWDDDDSAS